jgi:hypothetical protein
MAVIQDGGGKNGNVGVSKNQRLNVSSRSSPREFYTSRDDGLAFSAIYDDMTLVAGDICAYLKNTSTTRNLIVGDITAGGVSDGKYKLFSVSGTAAAGTPVTPAPVNLSKNIPAEATAMSGDTSITGLTNLAQLSCFRHPALSSWEEAFEGSLILGPGDAIAIEMDAGTGGVHEVDIHFHYEDFDA